MHRNSPDPPDISGAYVRRQWRGVPQAWAAELRRYPKLAARLKRALGKPPSREED